MGPPSAGMYTSTQVPPPEWGVQYIAYESAIANAGDAPPPTATAATASIVVVAATTFDLLNMLAEYDRCVPVS